MLWPFLPAVEHGDDFEPLPSKSVWNHVWGAGHDQLPCTRESTWTAEIREFGETLDGVEYRAGDFTGGVRMIAGNV